MHFIKKHLYISFVLLALIACDKIEEPILFSIQDDIDLGLQVKEEIEANPDDYPLLSEQDYPEAYHYLRSLWSDILSSTEVRYRDEFAWEIYIIHDDETLNAFATPGGYIYVYTGLIKYLDKEDDLAGVLGHEIAHSDLRHTSRNLQRIYGITTLLDIILGEDNSSAVDIARQLATGAAALSFSRAFEEEADDKSVDYLADSDYACNGAYYFFQKLLEAEDAGFGIPTFLSTHPAPQDRVDAINLRAEEVGCNTEPLAPASYDDFKNMLPQSDSDL